MDEVAAAHIVTLKKSLGELQASESLLRLQADSHATVMAQAMEAVRERLQWADRVEGNVAQAVRAVQVRSVEPMRFGRVC